MQQRHTGDFVARVVKMQVSQRGDGQHNGTAPRGQGPSHFTSLACFTATCAVPCFTPLLRELRRTEQSVQTTFGAAKEECIGDFMIFFACHRAGDVLLHFIHSMPDLHIDLVPAWRVHVVNVEAPATRAGAMRVVVRHISLQQLRGVRVHKWKGQLGVRNKCLKGVHET